jgi:twitching motility protein PilI
MSRLTDLRGFQQDLTRRIDMVAAEQAAHPTRLGIQAGNQFWLIRLDEAAEVLAVGAITPVPLTRPWYRGLTNVRGSLLNVIDYGHFLGGASTPISIDTRLVLVNERFHINVALLVTRMLGLRPLDQLVPADVPVSRPWVRQEYLDGEGCRWRELAMGELVYHADFMQIGN